MICICIIFLEISCVYPKPLLTEQIQTLLTLHSCFVCSSFTDHSLAVHLALARRSSNVTYSICNTCIYIVPVRQLQLYFLNLQNGFKAAYFKFSETIVFFTGIRKKLPLGDKLVLSKHTCNSLL